jgi:hypothetical protein
MVWAAEFVRVKAAGDDLDYCAMMATAAVQSLRSARGERALGDDARAALDDMLSTGGDRCPR